MKDFNLFKTRYLILTGLLLVAGTFNSIVAQNTDSVQAAGKSVQATHYQDFLTKPSGLQYKIHQAHGGIKPVTGDRAIMNLRYSLRKPDGTDSLLFASVKPFIVPVSPLYDGDIYEAIQLLGLGDSATFILEPTGFFTKTANAITPFFVTQGSRLVFEVKLNGIQTEKEYEKEQQLVKKQEDEKKDNEQAVLQQYIAFHKIKAQAETSGLYYIRNKGGWGRKARIGHKVSVEYRACFLNGEEFDSSLFDADL
ncbi:MAG: hypothetical protein NTU44_05990 [Bacteroidetes bacterium]|nr:hypothetical protein [Bacteroidota bacterium]